ncbi:uncharacterized protein JCM6883_001022 [Sporobolomyces salmoneus]|uniref:uncharacterized protein n=1 Tax=Sporobolomyces salmoneus TaxID=183962 RepID=UPI0031706482
MPNSTTPRPSIPAQSDEEELETIPSFAWGAYAHFLTPKVAEFFERRKETIPLVVGSAVMSLVTRLNFARQESRVLGHDPFLNSWYTTHWPITAGVTSINRQLSSKTEKQLERYLAYKEKASDISESAPSIYFGPTSRVQHAPKVEVEVSVSSMKLNLEQDEAKLMWSAVLLSDDHPILAWQLPAIAVLATNDLLRAQYAGHLPYLAVTLTVALRVWARIVPDRPIRRDEFLKAQQIFLKSNPPLVSETFSQDFTNKMSNEKIWLIDNFLKETYRAPQGIAAAGLIEVRDFLLNHNVVAPLPIPPPSSSRQRSPPPSDRSSRKRQRTSESLGKNPFLPCPRWDV